MEFRRVLFRSSRSLFDQGITLDNYRYIFTGRLPDAYLAEGANRAMISDAARQVPRSLANSDVISLTVMALNILIGAPAAFARSEEHTSELQSLMRISYAVFCLTKQNKNTI